MLDDELGVVEGLGDGEGVDETLPGMILNPNEFMLKDEERDWNEINNDVIPFLDIDDYKSHHIAVP